MGSGVPMSVGWVWGGVNGVYKGRPEHKAV